MIKFDLEVLKNLITKLIHFEEHKGQIRPFKKLELN